MPAVDKHVAFKLSGEIGSLREDPDALAGATDCFPADIVTRDRVYCGPALGIARRDAQDSNAAECYPVYPNPRAAWDSGGASPYRYPVVWIVLVEGDASHGLTRLSLSEKSSRRLGLEIRIQSDPGVVCCTSADAPSLPVITPGDDTV